MFNTLRVRLTVVFPALLSLCGTCPAAADAPAFSLRVVNGRAIPPGDSAVVEIRERTQHALALCTGSVIASRVVITAAHCILSKAKSIVVMVDGRKMRVRKTVIHPGAARDPVTGIIVNDVGLMFVRKRIPRPVTRILISRSPQPGEALQVAGYGLDEQGQIGVLKEGSIPLNDLTAQFLVTVYDGSSSDPCSGDSGGPAFFKYSDSGGQVHNGIVGIISGGTSSDCAPGDLTLYTNVQSPEVVDFIRAEVPRAHFD